MTPFSTEWDALFSVLGRSAGPQELEFKYLPETEGLPRILYCIAQYEFADDSFDTGGYLGTETHLGYELLDIEVYSQTGKIDPDSLEPGLSNHIRTEALQKLESL